MTLSRLLSLLLGLSALTLAVMIPGGVVETRNFPNYSLAVLGAFNVFLTFLGLGSLLLAWRWPHAAALAWAMGVAYVAVYGLDLAGIFPVSEAPMSARLAVAEWVGLGLGLGVMGVAGCLTLSGRAQAVAGAKLPRWLLVGLGALTLAIVTFATRAAM